MGMHFYKILLYLLTFCDPALSDRERFDVILLLFSGKFFLNYYCDKSIKSLRLYVNIVRLHNQPRSSIVCTVNQLSLIVANLTFICKFAKVWKILLFCEHGEHGGFKWGQNWIS